MSTPYQELLDAAHDLLNEIEGSDYEDMVHSSERVNRLKEVSGWPSKVRVYGEPAPTWLNSKPMDGRIMVKNTGAKPSRDYFDIHTYTGDNSAARKNFEETVEVLPPMACKQPQREWQGLTDEEVLSVMESAKDFQGRIAMTWVNHENQTYVTDVGNRIARAIEQTLRGKNT